MTTLQALLKLPPDAYEVAIYMKAGDAPTMHVKSYMRGQNGKLMTNNDVLISITNEYELVPKP